MLNAEQIIAALRLQPHPIEGGFFRETWRSVETWVGPGGRRSVGTAIYYLLTPETYSEMHRLPGDEVFHFYLGDPVTMLQIRADGCGQTMVLGNRLDLGHQPQVVVPRGTWQGSYLADGGTVALLGATMAPGFDYSDYETGRRDELVSAFPDWAALIRRLTSPS